jgi:cytochrome P450
MPPDWSWIFGHLISFGKRVASLPPDVDVLALTGSLSDELKSDTYLLDMWPISVPTIFTSDLAVSNDVLVKHNLPKPMLLKTGLLPISGGPDLVSMDGPQWKFWRGVFNHGFSMAATTAQIPAIVDSVEIFCQLLRAKATSGDVFALENLTRRLTMDVILKVVLDLDVDNQRSENDLSYALHRIIEWHSFWDPRILLNPLRLFVQGYYNRVMNRVILHRLQELFTEMRSDNTSSLPGTKSVASLALKGYLEEETTDKTMMQRDELDPHFAKFTTYQVRVFLFAGNDTTASSICWIYTQLAENPSAVAKMREEHDQIFGTDPTRVGALLRENPNLVNKLEYTMAVIKETLRLEAVATATRAGLPGLTLTDSNGVILPTGESSIVINSPRSMRDPKHWPRATEFLPERWLVEPGHPLCPGSKDLYRPFMIGPRSCIAQNLVYHELKVVLAMTVRTLEIKAAYTEWDASQRAEEGWWKRALRNMGVADKINTVDGKRLYHTDSPGSSPSDGFPCKVTAV